MAIEDICLAIERRKNANKEKLLDIVCDRIRGIGVGE